MPPEISNNLDVLLPLAGALLLVLGVSHVVLHVRDVRAAVGWAGIIILLPFGGALLYWVFGINRVRRSAVIRLRRTSWLDARRTPVTPHPELGALEPLARLGDAVTGRPLLAGNLVTPLVDGDEAFPAMLHAIQKARRSIHLTSYIFDRDSAGLRFADALVAAVARGVDVRVIIDAVGARYSFPSIVRLLRRRGVRVVRFNPTFFPPWRWKYANLRCHRKLLIVDGSLGFTGGINIREGHLILEQPSHPARDLHFRLEGPVVADLQRAFAEDWSFTTRERPLDVEWFPPLHACGSVHARGITDGPDVDLNALRWTVLGALACARERVRIVTPYFLPEGDMLSLIRTTVMRGVRVEFVLPSKLNLRLVQWAAESFHSEVLEAGATLTLTRGPFDHSKVILVDDTWALIGSTNLDPRSLRLNFEFNVECYDPALVRTLDRLIDARVHDAHSLSLEEAASASLFRRLRNGLLRLFTPYL